MTNVAKLKSRVQTKWDAYIAAKIKVDETDSMDAAIVAARAWRDWLDEFMTDQQRNFVNR